MRFFLREKIAQNYSRYTLLKFETPLSKQLLEGADQNKGY